VWRNGSHGRPTFLSTSLDSGWTIQVFAEIFACTFTSEYFILRKATYDRWTKQIADIQNDGSCRYLANRKHDGPAGGFPGQRIEINAQGPAKSEHLLCKFQAQDHLRIGQATCRVPLRESWELSFFTRFTRVMTLSSAAELLSDWRLFLSSRASLLLTFFINALTRELFWCNNRPGSSISWSRHFWITRVNHLQRNSCTESSGKKVGPLRSPSRAYASFFFGTPVTCPFVSGTFSDDRDATGDYINVGRR